MTYDATSGNTYTYNPENRITGAGKFTYTYDSDGNRVEKSNGGAGTIYWYMTPGIVMESDLSGNLKSEYLFFDDLRVARRDFPSAAVWYYFSDHLKTASVITDPSGNLATDEDYYPWGGELQMVNKDSNHYKFTGKERDPETGLDQMGARYYGNWLGRFATPDPLQWLRWQNGNDKGQRRFLDYISNPQNFNQYAYALNSPKRFSDPTGLYVCTGSKTQCSNLKAAYDKAGEALKGGNLTKQQKADLQKTLNFLGKPGDANGVVVKFGDTVKGSSGDTHSSQLNSGETLTTITLNANDFSSATVAQRAQTFAHEGTHGVDGDARGGRDPETKDEVMATERHAYGVQADVAKGLNVWSPWGLWDPDWKPDVATKNMNAAIEKGAKASTAIWCANGGNCK